MSIDAMKQALEYTRPGAIVPVTLETVKILVDALRLAIEQAERQEPVGSFMTREQAIEFCRRRRPNIEPTEQQITATLDAYAALFGDLVPAPPQREWQGLTDEEIKKIFVWQEWSEDFDDFEHIARAIEAKLREKNG